MAEEIPAFIEGLAARHRVLILGGHAVIYMGLDRPTYDADIWLDPMPDAHAWSAAVSDWVAALPGAYLWNLAAREKIDARQLPETVVEFGVVRIGGLSEDLDVFRRPNNLEETDFDECWRLAGALEDSPARVLHPVDLLATKLETGREKDQGDIAFIEAKIRTEWSHKLAACPPAEAQSLFARYADHVTCLAALDNPHPEVRALAVEMLREFAAQNNPFARELLAERGL